MDRIEINTSKAKQTANQYKNIISELDAMTKDLKKCIDNISGKWKGKASDTFTMDHFPKLYADMQKNIKMLEALQKEINLTADDFEKLDVELKAKF